MDSSSFFRMLQESDEFYKEKRKSKELPKIDPEFADGSSCVPGHLNTPIYMTEVDMLLNCKKEDLKCKRHKDIYSYLFDHDKPGPKSILHYTFDYMSFLCKWLSERTIIRYTDPLEELTELYSFLDVWELHYLNFHQSEIGNPTQKKDPLRYKELRAYCEIIKSKARGKISNLTESFRNMKKAEHLKDQLTYKETARGRFRETVVANGKILAERDLTILEENYPQKRTILLPTSMLLCAVDALQCRFPLYLYWSFCDIFDKYPGLNMLNRGMSLIKEFEKIRTQMRVGFFSFLSMWEALIIGYIIKDPQDIGCVALYNTQFEEIRQIFLENKIAIDQLEKVLPISNTQVEYMYMLEMIGISKCFGYPILKADKLLEQLRLYGCAPQYPINLDTINEIDGICKREFTINYFKKRESFPIFDYVPMPLRKHLYRNALNERKLKDISLEIWAQLSFKKTLNYDYTPDQTALIKDSSSAPNLDAWSIQYDGCAFRYLYDKKPPRPGKLTSNLRTIKAFLTSDEDYVRKLIHQRELGIYNEQDHVSVQCGKERELKEDSGRAFTKQTADHRLIQTSMEYNISNQIFPFVPGQSMTDGEVKLVIKMMFQARQLQQDRHEFICLDLKKFCIHELAITNHRAGVMFDELFGLNGLFTNSHKSFVDCNIFTNNRLTPPDYDQNGNPIPGTYFMNKYVGGFEGMHQKKWTFVAVHAILLAIEKCNLQAYSMGQGDNQIIIIEHKKTDSIEKRSQIRVQFLNMLEKIFKDINLKLKEKETWYSKHLYEYGKNRVYRGSCISLGTKKCTRVQPDINDGLCAITSCMSTLNTLTEAISRGDFSPHPAFMLNCMLMGNFIKRKRIELNTLKIKSLLCFPNDFGGFPLSTLYSHMVRGHSDNITTWLSIYKTLSIFEDFRGIKEYVRRLWRTHPTYPAQNSQQRAHLYEDPYSLNISQLPSADPIIKTKTLQYLMSDEVTNPMIKRLYDTSAALSKETVISAVDRMDPVYPQVGHELLVNSNAGLFIRMQQKFTSNKTIEGITNIKYGISLLTLIHEKNKELIDIVKRKFNKNIPNVHPIVDEPGCVVEIADKLRELNWGKKILFVSKSYYPCQVSVYPVDSVDEKDVGNSILVSVNDQCLTNPHTLSFAYGCFTPYIGSTTREKMKKQSIDFGERTSFTIALENLQKLKSWFIYMNWTGQVRVVDMLIDEKLKSLPVHITRDDIDQVLPQIISGNIVHRFQTEMESSYALLNGLPSISSNFSQSTNLLRGMTKQGEDWTIFFQLIFISNIALFTSKMLRERKLVPFYYVQLSCTSCTKEIETSTLAQINFDCPDGVKILNQELPITGPLTQSPICNPNEIYFAMSFSIGKMFAKNIDANFKHYHLDRISDSSGSKPISFEVSMNDLKHLDLSIIFATLITYSRHCLEIIRDRIFLKCFNNDKSFTFFSECVINAGLQKRLLDLMEIDIVEHSTITKVEKFSYLLSRHIQAFFQKHSKLCYQCHYLVAFKGQELNQNANLDILISEIVNSQFEGQGLRKVTELNFNKLYHRLKYVWKLNPCIFLSIEEYEITKYWRAIRSSDFTYSNLNHFMEQKYSLRKIPERRLIELPIVAIKQYWICRIQDTVPTLDYPFLSYLTRAIGTLSSAATKYVEILLYLNLTNILYESGKTIYCLAEGAGGTLATLSHLFPKTTLCYNTFNINSIDPKDDICFVDPPASQDFKHDFNSRILHKKVLNLGTTDIIDDIFIGKLTRCMEENKPVIVTMDAESMEHSSNLKFVYALIPQILDFQPELVIFKMFFMIDLLQSIDMFKSQMNCPSNYTWSFYKPISSNPVGFEIFLIIIRADIAAVCTNLNQLRKDGMSFMNQVKKAGFVKRNLKMDTQSFHKYIDTSKHLLLFYKSLFEDTPIYLQNRYTHLVREKLICSLGCKRLFSKMLVHLGEINDHKKQESALIIVREGGSLHHTYRVLLDFIYLSLKMGGRKKYKDVAGIVSVLDTISLSEDKFDDYRFGRTLNVIQVVTGQSGNFFDQWSDRKIFLRDMLLSKPCKCDTLTLRIKKSTFDNFISILIYEDLKQIFGLSPMLKNIDVVYDKTCLLAELEQ